MTSGMPSSSALHYGIIEGTDVKLERLLSQLDPLVLSTQYTNGVEVSSIVYNGKEDTIVLYHDGDDDDKGFFDYYDEYHDRHIFVTEQDIGSSQSFHDDYEIQFIWNVIKPCSSHEHSSSMTKKRQQWFMTNIKNVCLQMFNTGGNIAIFCNSDDSNSCNSCSPMYLVAYLALFCHLSFEKAYHFVEIKMRASREQILDRHCPLYDVVAFLISEMIPSY
jgi:hypothetical protein